MVHIYVVNGDDHSPASEAALWRPPAPANVSTSVSGDDVTLTWDAVSDATKYRYRTQKGSAAFSAWTEASSAQS